MEDIDRLLEEEQKKNLKKVLAYKLKLDKINKQPTEERK
jgi:hypothetical protein